MVDKVKTTKKTDKVETLKLSQMTDKVKAGYDEKTRIIHIQVKVPLESEYEYTTSTEDKPLGKRNIKINTGAYLELPNTDFRINPSVILKENKKYLKTHEPLDD